MAKYNEIKHRELIVNGTPTEDSLNSYKDDGYILVGQENANKFHPYAVSTDIILFFAKPIDKEEYDKHMADSYINSDEAIALSPTKVTTEDGVPVIEFLER